MPQRLAPIALFLAGMAAATWPLLSSGFALMEVDPADTRHLNYVLEHDWRWLSGAAALWSPPFFFPQENVAAFTELMLAVLPFYAPWRALGAEPDTAFQLWMITVLALNFLAAHALFRGALQFEPLPAAAGAFMLAFGSARMASLNHQHLLPFFYATLALHAVVMLARTGRRVWVAVFFAALALQFWACITVAWFFCFWLAVAFLWSRAWSWLRPHALAVAIGAIAFAATLVPLLMHYGSVEKRSFAEAVSMVPQLQSWLYQGPHSVLYGRLAELSVFTRLPMEGEHRLGVGLVTTLVMIAMLRGQHRWLGLTALTIIALATLYRGKVTPWQLVMATVPGADGIRAVGRIGMMMMVPASIAVATLAARARRAGQAVVALCLAEQLQRVPDTYSKLEQRADVARVAAAVPKDCRAFFYAPKDREKYDEKTQLDAMWAGLAVGVPTVNGYSSHFPRGWELFDHGVHAPADEQRLKAALERWTHQPVCWVWGHDGNSVTSPNIE